MDSNTILSDTKTKFDTAVSHLQEELKKIRTGRAHPGMLDGIMAEAYGAPMPLNQLATISAPEPQLLQISPFDPGNLQAISAAIRDNQSLGLNPMDDGHVVRVPIPPLTEERRREMAKQLSGKVEDCMIRLRNARHEALKVAETAKKDKQLTEDDVKSIQKQLDDLVQKHKLHIDELTKAKEAEIMTV